MRWDSLRITPSLRWPSSIHLVGVVLEHHARESVHGAQRGAQVVGNGITEGLQLLVGGDQLGGTGFQIRVKLADFLLRMLALGDVEIDADHARGLAVRPNDDHLGGLDETYRLVGRADDPELALIPPASGDGVGQPAFLFRQILRQEPVPPVLIEHPTVRIGGHAVNFEHPPVPAEGLAFDVPLPDADGRHLGGEVQPLAADPQRFFRQFPFGDVGADRDELGRLAATPTKWDDRGVHPVGAAVLRAVFHFALPDLAIHDRLPEFLEIGRRVVAGIDDAVVLADQLLHLVFGNRAEFVVGVGDYALGVGDGDEGVFIERGLEVGKGGIGRPQFGGAFRHPQLESGVEAADFLFRVSYAR